MVVIDAEDTSVAVDWASPLPGLASCPFLEDQTDFKKEKNLEDRGVANLSVRGRLVRSDE